MSWYRVEIDDDGKVLRLKRCADGGPGTMTVFYVWADDEEAAKRLAERERQPGDSSMNAQDKSILDRVRKLAAELYDLDASDITADSTIIDDIGVDSLGLVEGVLLLEEEFELDIPDEDSEQWRTVGDVVKYIEEKTAK